MPRFTATSRRNTGFSMIELLVAISITSVLIFLVHTIFRDTSSAVTYGIRTSNIVASARTMGDQLQNDAEAMLPPVASSTVPSAGFLVIGNSTINGVRFRDHQDSDGESQANVRVDQIVFFRDATGLTPLTPQNANTTGNALAGFFAARVSYGHADRTELDGSRGAGLTNDADTFGNDWILSRHALLLPNDATLTANVSASRHAANAGSYATVNNPGSAPGSPPNASSGITDVTVANYLTAANARRTNTSDDGHTVMTFFNQRISVNPRPMLDPAADTAANLFETWRIAQGHPYFIGGVSDFIVEFAGDLDGDGEIDKDTGLAGNAPDGARDGNDADTRDGPIFWYDGYKLADNTVVDASKNTLNAAAPGAGQSTHYNRVAGTPAAIANADLMDHVLVFRIDDEEDPLTAASESEWPFLIRIRYRVHDSQGKVYSIDPSTGNRILGRWFEHIIPVRRVPTS